MHGLGIFMGLDLKRRSLEELKERFGKHGEHYYSIARALDERLVNPNRERKSLGAETTFARDSHDVEELKKALLPLCEIVASRLEQAHLQGRVVVLKVKFSDFRIITRRATLPLPIHEPEEIHAEVVRLLVEHVELIKSVRLIGVSLQGLEEAGKIRPFQPPLPFMAP
jgi:DNA polymerase IV